MDLETVYEQLRKGEPELGHAARLPWDEPIFGFPVADYRAPGHWDEPVFGLPVADYQETGHEATPPAPARIAAALEAWCEPSGVELVHCGVEAGDRERALLLEEVGFRAVELTLSAALIRLQRAELPEARIGVRPFAGDPGDLRSLEDIARTCFEFGRYRSDPRFPAKLARERFAIWIHNACEKPGPGDRVLLQGPLGSPTGFMHVRLEGSRAQLCLGGVDTRLNAAIAGPALFVATLHELREAGVRRVSVRLAAANTAVLNIYAALGFSFQQPVVAMHWYAPGARTRVPPPGNEAHT